MTKLNIEDAALAVAASITERAHDLIQDGWVKGRMYTKEDGAPVAFCILGALELAMQETFGSQPNWMSHPAVELAAAFIMDEAAGQYKHRHWNETSQRVASPGMIPGFNDPAERQLEQVLSVMREAARRLWDLSVEREQVAPAFEFSRWADVGVTEEASRDYLHAVLN